MKKDLQNCFFALHLHYQNNNDMITTIKDLKKGDKFTFCNDTYLVKQKFSKWKRSDEPYLVASCGQIFYNEDLEVQLIN